MRKTSQRGCAQTASRWPAGTMTHWGCRPCCPRLALRVPPCSWRCCSCSHCPSEGGLEGSSPGVLLNSAITGNMAEGRRSISVSTCSDFTNDKTKKDSLVQGSCWKERNYMTGRFLFLVFALGSIDSPLGIRLNSNPIGSGFTAWFSGFPPFSDPFSSTPKSLPIKGSW